MQHDAPQFKPSHQVIKAYYEELADYLAHNVSHEQAVRSAFQNLLAKTAKKAGWHLVPEQPTRVRVRQLRPDGTLRDHFNLHRGYWEAKDSTDKLDVEIRLINLRVSGNSRVSPAHSQKTSDSARSF